MARFGFVRYADDFIVAGRSEEALKELLPLIKEWLSKRGLKLNEEKTTIRQINDGFDFLGFTIRRLGGGRCFTVPNKKKVLAFLKGINSWLREHPDLQTQDVISYLNPRLRGFCNFYRFGVSAEVFSYMQHILWTHLWRWARRRHPHKSRKWVADKYFQLPGWRFFANGTDRQKRRLTFRLMKPTDVKIVRHVKINGSSSPDDPALQTYWYIRASKQGRTLMAKGSDEYHLALRQRWLCVECGTFLLNGEPIHIHHVEPIQTGGPDRLRNMVLVHSLVTTLNT